jgi:capsule polysaccharide export protein KpsE/RkpR
MGLGELLGMKTSDGLVLGILNTTAIKDRMISRFELSHVYHRKYREDLRERLDSHTDVVNDAKSQIISITVRDRSPQRAESMANAYVEELNKILASLNTSTAHRERVFLQGRLDEVKKDLDDAAVELSKFSSKNTAIDIPEQAKAMVGAAANLQGELIAARSELSGLQQIYSDNNVRVSSLKARIGELERQLNKLGGNDESMNAEHQLYPAIRQLPLLAVKYYDLYRRTKIEETVFEMLTKQFELAKVQEAKEVGTVSVVEQPLVADRRSGPPRMLVIVALTLFSVLYSIVWCVGLEKWRRIEPANDQKILLSEIANALKESMPESWKGRSRSPRRSRSSIDSI